MWRITKLYLKNFLHIYSGMGKTELELDLSNNDKRVNIFIGKMGSGKSAILGHLQPFATYGSLDVRNQNGVVIPGKDGMKKISFLHDTHIYDIQHQYSWNKSSRSHSTKSYIQLDGVELNENGNIRSFKEIIRTEFGIDQNFLRLLRLGPNVANLINMKSSERKSFIASLLKDTEIYTTLYSKLSEDYRNMNSTLSVLSNKLVSLSSSKENELKLQLEDLEDELKDLIDDIDKVKEAIAILRGSNQTLVDNRDVNTLLGMIDSLEKKMKESKNKYEEISIKLSHIPDNDSRTLAVQYGEMSTKLLVLEEKKIGLSQNIEDTKTARSKTREFLLLHENDRNLESLKRSFTEIENKYFKARDSLHGFSCPYSYTYLVDLIDMITNFQFALDDMCTNDKEVIAKLYHSDSTVKSWANKRADMLAGKRFNTQKRLSNINFSTEYECTIPLFRPPLCPTEDCPFIKSHPEIIKLQYKDKRKTVIVDMTNELAAIDKELALVEAIASQYSRMVYLKNTWNTLSAILGNIGALYEPNLFKILSKLDIRCNWYDHAKLISVTELAKTQEDFKKLESHYYEMKNEMYSLNSNEIEIKKKELIEIESRYDSLLSELQTAQDEYIDLSAAKVDLEEIISTMAQADSLRSLQTTLSSTMSTDQSTLDNYRDRMLTITSNYEQINIYQARLASLNISYTTKSSMVSKLRMNLQDIESTKSSYQEYLDERNILKMILDAVSSKDGIPLILVKVFLDECKEIINELISDIFEDDLEILEFSLSEDVDDFKIPFASNGNPIEDIEFASQGQQAVISIALSFALCRKSMFDYNIPLFDEIDNSIHRADREKFISILFKQMRALGTSQTFLITHNDIFQQSGLPINVIMTTPEVIDKRENQDIIQLF